MPLRKLSLFLMLIATSSPAIAEVNSSTVTLNFSKSTIDPGDPTININAHPSVVIQVEPSTLDYRIWPAFAPRKNLNDALENALRSVSSIRQKSSQVSNLEAKLREARERDPVIFELPAVFSDALASLPADEKAQLEQVRTQIETALKEAPKLSVVGHRTVLNFQTAKSNVGDSAVLDRSGNLWTVTLAGRKRSRDYPVEVECISEKGCPRHRQVVVVHVDSAQFDLSWSGGFVASWLRDERFRIDPPAAEGEDAPLVKLKKDDVPYRLAAFAHYCPVKDGWQWICPSVGLATDVPVTSLSIMLGPAIRVRPIPTVNSGYLTAGVVYGAHKVLNDDYAERSMPTVPVGTTVSSLLTTKYGFHLYVGLTFGFFGSEDKFKGVYPGAAKKGEAPSQKSTSSDSTETSSEKAAGSGASKDVGRVPSRELKPKILELLAARVEPATVEAYVRAHLSAAITADEIAEWKEDGIPENVIRAAVESGGLPGKK